MTQTAQQGDLFDQSFYSTSQLKGEELEAAEGKAKTDSVRVLEYFRSNPYGKFTPFDVQKVLDPKGEKPITSFRRAMTNLTKDGYLTKTDEQKVEKFGSPNFYCRLNV